MFKLQIFQMVSPNGVYIDHCLKHIKVKLENMIYKTIFPIFQDGSTCKFTTWAPKAKSLKLIINGYNKAFEMQQDEFGYWSVIVKDVYPGLRYRYQIDGSGSFPD